MVKFANKPKGRPSKRKSLKTKYKIERKIKQHNKRVKKEAKKLKGKGLKHKGIARSDALPNMFPFKQQILDSARAALPQKDVVEVVFLDKTELGLVNLENKCAYLPKAKNNLIKKYVSALDNTLQKAKIVLEVLDARCPRECIDQQFRQTCKRHKVTIISVLTKIDTVFKEHLSRSIESIKSQCPLLVSFSSDHKRKEQSLSDLFDALRSVSGSLVLVAGKSLTGKHTLITLLAKAARCYQQNPCQIQSFKLDKGIDLIDSPYRINDNTGYPLFNVPNPLIEESQSLQAQQEQLIRQLFLGECKQKPIIDRDGALQHYSIQDFNSVSDFVSKVGRASKQFGKGGSIDTTRARNKIIADWFTGKLNHIITPQ